MRLTSTALLAALLLGPADPVGGQGQAALEVTTARFLRGENTLVDGFCKVPFGFLQALGPNGAAYSLTIAVSDADGAVLNESGWSQTVASQFLNVAGASTVEHFSFSVPAGSYAIAVTLADSASGRTLRGSTAVEAFATETQMSDLLLAPSMRRAAEAGGTPAPGEVVKGSIYLTAAAVPVLTPQQAELSYYMEFYPGEHASVSMTTRVLAGDGSVVTATQPEALQVGAGGGIAARALDLTGLPEGAYRLEVSAELPGGTAVREAAFRMGGFATDEAIAELVAGPARQDVFAELTEDRLDSLYAPLLYIMEGPERGIYESLSLEGKRNYMRQFWQRRDPTPGTPENESRVAYYLLFEDASRRFRESGAGDVPGWRTDRGRIFLKHGEPEEVLRRPASGATPPYEVWKYSRPRQLKYVFLDETGLGNYALIWTDDRFETSRPDWERLLGTEAVQDVERF